MIDLTTPILALDGAAIPDVTVKKLCVEALLTPFADEPSLSGEDKVERFVLAHRLANVETIALRAEEIALIKRLVGKAYAPLAVGRVWAALDPASVDHAGR